MEGSKFDGETRYRFDATRLAFNRMQSTLQPRRNELDYEYACGKRFEPRLCYRQDLGWSTSFDFEVIDRVARTTREVEAESAIKPVERNQSTIDQMIR